MIQLGPAQIQAIRELAREHGVASVRVFGSMARGTATDDSDLDILVQFKEAPNLIQVIGFKEAEEEELGIKADVVEEGALSPYIEEMVFAEAIAL